MEEKKNIHTETCLGLVSSANFYGDGKIIDALNREIYIKYKMRFKCMYGLGWKQQIDQTHLKFNVNDKSGQKDWRRNKNKTRKEII